ncbi:unnamed protein product [Mycena citricolor]|uniref:Protein kinase domain-containing protein n=1 Tax=Mycena citricolor TaxID=2018698 RepID=A0AAD2JVM7_9AGAR|nr:unnamed protein product [Mycena citricolor]
MSDTLDLGAPFSAWPEDTPWPLPLGYEMLKQSNEISVRKFSGKTRTLVCKQPDPPDTSAMAREIQIVQQAGDCSVSYLGRYYHERQQQVRGLIMPFESAIVPSAIETRAERVALIHELCDLTRRFHSRGLVHGDIKPDNLLRCSDGTLRFCDFGNSCFAGDEHLTAGPTMSYETAMRFRAVVEMPPTVEEDYHSLAMTIWELYTGGNDFWIEGIYFRGGCSDDETYDLVRDCIELGRCPDMRRIDDSNVAKLILKYLSLGPSVEDVDVQTRIMCYQKTYRLRNCRCVPECTIARKFTCMTCEEAQPPPMVCPRLYVEPFMRDPAVSSPSCTCSASSK